MFEDEYSKCGEYELTFMTLKEEYLQVTTSKESESVSGSAANSPLELQSLKLKRPDIKKFDGELSNWIAFWAQFQKIHEDPGLRDEDKFCFLLNSLKPNSAAQKLIDGFPPSRENYAKAIETLRSRYGKEENLIEYYVRELLGLVLNRAEHRSIAPLFDQLEAQLRALDSLGVTTEKYAAMLFPLVESSVPEQTFKVWERHRISKNASMKNPEDCMTELLDFLRIEVEGEERLKLRMATFEMKPGKKLYKTKPNEETKVSTASALVSTGEVQVQNRHLCIFCDASHRSAECGKAIDMTLRQRQEILKRKGCCFRCLNKGHLGDKCKSYIKCVICRGKHYPLLCPRTSSVSDPQEKGVSTGTAQEAAQTLYTKGTLSQAYLQTLVAWVRTGSQERRVRILLDGGSQRSYIVKRCAKELDLKPDGQLSLGQELFGGQKMKIKTHNVYTLTFKTSRNSECSVQVLDEERICGAIPRVRNDSLLKLLNSKGIYLSDLADNAKESEDIHVLLGADALPSILTSNLVRIANNLVAMETTLGWVLIGCDPGSNAFDNSNTVLTTLLTGDLTNLWELDVLGITEPANKKTNQEAAQQAMELFAETVTRDSDGRYVVRLPWLEGHPPLANNFEIAERRLWSTISSLRKRNLFEAYDNVFKEWLQLGIIEIAAQMENGNCHYLPHRPVVKMNSLTTKIRPVFDASAHVKGKPALNHCLEKGPNLIEQIPSVMLRFRLHKIGVVADILKAFLQLGVHKSDQDHLRFLWVDGKQSLIEMRHKRVVFGVNCSPYLLGATIAYHLEDCKKKSLSGNATYSVQTIEKLGSSFYVDNCVTSVPEKADLAKFISEARTIMSEGKFDLRGWEHSSQMDSSDQLKSTNVLGLTWDMKTDFLKISEESMTSGKRLQDDKVTKRIILSVAQQVFDPIGFSCSVSLTPKLLLQQVWRGKYGWDDPVDEEIGAAFNSWANDLPHLLSVEMPRWINYEDGDVLSLHVFCDASKDAYSAVIFSRVEKDDYVFVNLLAAKSRVAPMKELSIPRLELLAATIGARLYQNVVQSLGVSPESYFWSDSSTVVSWITRSEDWTTFVWNRVEEIRSLTPREAWRHVPGTLNPADLPSRGCTARQLVKSRWWEGPKFLYSREEKWPGGDVQENEEEINQEKKKRLVSVLLNSAGMDWHVNYFSSHVKAVRMIAWIHRFIHNARPCSAKRVGPLAAEEFNIAEIFLFKLIQGDSLADGTQRNLQLLGAFQDSTGLIRVKSRISNRDDSEDFLLPIVLPSNNEMVKRLILHHHVQSCHAGTQTLLGILRERFWVLGGRKTVRSAISRCMPCKRLEARKFEVITPPLPLRRVRDAVPFEVSGVDFAGPLYLKNGEKAWICLFTCSVYRAVHLELTTSLSAPAFIQVLRRFCARRGKPKQLNCDHGTNFVGTANLLEKLHWDKVQDYSSTHNIKWIFNPPTAPWWGGYYERLIGMLKRLLRRVLGKANLSFEELLTILCDCEAVMNARPLSYLSEDCSDLTPLTPQSFLRESVSDELPDLDCVDRELLSRRMKYLQGLRDLMRRRFREEYLGQLSQPKRKKVTRRIRLGELVLVGNDNPKRIDWPLGRVEELLSGKDGEVRLVRVRTVRGSLLRPVQRLYPLECGEEATSSSPGDSSDNYSYPGDSSTTSTSPEEPLDSAGVSCDPRATQSRAPDKVTKSGRKVKFPKRFLDD